MLWLFFCPAQPQSYAGFRGRCESKHPGIWSNFGLRRGHFCLYSPFVQRSCAASPLDSMRVCERWFALNIGDQLQFLTELSIDEYG